MRAVMLSYKILVIEPANTGADSLFFYNLPRKPLAMTARYVIIYRSDDRTIAVCGMRQLILRQMKQKPQGILCNRSSHKGGGTAPAAFVLWAASLKTEGRRCHALFPACAQPERDGHRFRH